jgi:hypothetical protein
MRRLVLLVAVAGCDPVWGVHTTLRDPTNRPVDGATVAVACQEDLRGINTAQMAVRSDHDGVAHVGGLGTQFPVGCDVFVAKPGYRTHRIRYRDICPNGPQDCDRVVGFDLVLEPAYTIAPRSDP